MMVDPEDIRRSLRTAEEHVRLGAARIASQKAVVGLFQARGHDATMASQILDTFEQVQLTYVAARDRFAAQLAATG